MPLDLVVIAIVRRAVGLQGLVAVETYGETFASLVFPATVYFGKDEKQVREVVIEYAEVRPRGYAVKFETVNERNGAEAIQGCSIYIKQNDLPQLDQEKYYQFELLGMQVQTEDGGLVGKVREIHNFPTMDALEVERPDSSELLLPFIEQSLIGVDKEKRIITVKKSFIDELI